MELSVLTNVPGKDWHIVGGGLPAEVPVVTGVSPTLLNILDRAEAIAAVIDHRLGVDTISPRFMELTCAGVSWPAIQLLREREARWIDRAPWAADVLHINECRARLWYVLRKRIIEWRLARAALGIRDRFGGADELANALYVALLTDRPFTTVTGLVRKSGTTRTTFYEQWKVVFGLGGALTPHRFLQHVLLLRGLAASGARGDGDRAVAQRLDVARSTLDAAAHALLGVSFSAAEETLALKALHEFESGPLYEMGIVVGGRTAG